MGRAPAIPGPGGWAWATAPDGALRDSGGEAQSTNQRMEIMAVLQALRSLDGPLTDRVGFDLRRELLPRQVVGAVAGQRLEERQEGTGRQRRPVATADRVGAGTRTPVFRWVKGHSGDPMNDLVDALAVAASKGPFTAQPPPDARRSTPNAPCSTRNPKRVFPIVWVVGAER